MLNRYEIERLDDLLIQTEELSEYKALNDCLPISVQKAINQYEKQLNLEIQRMVKAHDPSMTVMQVKQFAHELLCLSWR